MLDCPDGLMCRFIKNPPANKISFFVRKNPRINSLFPKNHYVNKINFSICLYITSLHRNCNMTRGKNQCGKSQQK